MKGEMDDLTILPFISKREEGAATGRSRRRQPGGDQKLQIFRSKRADEEVTGNRRRRWLGGGRGGGQEAETESCRS
ncbi:hypothetical protein E3N88_23279 [Mikania micrantha]|uniref:Uncharacterized protein n=1 Tax=Mikania micrantha TaxID=192012 RepID=A0A5N6NFJ4_9ASTR|nr:hypothetical protein E3N88_23279 [Mikania micrantha]